MRSSAAHQLHVVLVRVRTRLRIRSSTGANITNPPSPTSCPPQSQPPSMADRNSFEVTPDVANGGEAQHLHQQPQHQQPQQQQQQSPTDAYLKDVQDITHSDIGLTTLLDRLKQSIASAREFAGFLKKRSTVEEDHAKSLKRLARSTNEAIHHADSRQGTYARQIEEAMRTHEKMADNGMQFALSLHQMHEDLTELTNNMERGRKTWKHTSLDAEKKASDAEALMNRAKTKYDSLAEDYDRAKTGDVKGSRKFIKGPKSAAQYEEDVLRKLQAADSDYQDKVNGARAQRQELVSSTRPRASKAIQDLIRECDSALTLQLQKFATFNEKLLLGNGILITPLPSETASNRSLRDIMTDIDNDRDLHSYILAQKSKVPPRTSEIQYIKHPTLAPKQAAAVPGNRQPSSNYPVAQSVPTQEHPPVPQKDNPYQPPPPVQDIQIPQHTPNGQSPYNPASPSQDFPRPPSATQAPPYSPPPQQPQYNSPPYPVGPEHSMPQPHQPSQPMQIPYHNGPPASAAPSSGGPQMATSPGANNMPPPVRPVFGVDLEELFQRDGSAVPMVVYQCMQAVDLFGLSVEGIYRQNGTAQHIQQLKANFDHDASRVDFRNPASFHHDVNSVAGLLKQFFRDLPDPLLTKERYSEFISAARIEDDIVRRDTLHAIINGLPDANYATLRALVLHLNRIQEHQNQNRMSSSNLAICFAPSLMGVHGGIQIQDSAVQAKVIDTILVNTYQIFDED
ncbi:RhoGAP-domain-containing protein [Myriangium duriaei CBS 260.36]|uniref:RhoGAP-domain-containing protein n=1 Tax=Myriangium duriaei CBS 260.36 TaxID=1168546 RepID=A0A9P4J0V9_9PEZI|nr:RhoGAP-domain-containing protein [Myriangium duriaei CBS 260.36]